MKKFGFFFAVFACCTNLWAQYPGQTENLIKIKTEPALKALSFDFADVQLLDGPFKTAMEIDQRWLKEADVERFLHNYRVTAGLKSNAQAFEGWEGLDVELRGHSLGHILTALAEMYATTGDTIYKNKGDIFVRELAECQSALGESGYLSAFPEHLIDRAIEGKPVWAPWYTLHKIYQGVLDMYTICGNEQAYQIVLKMADWAYNKLKPLSHKELQRMLSCEFGGMPEVFYNLYAISGDKHHLELGDMFYHDAILDPLAQQIDQLGGTHANTQIPKIIGEARGYELTARKKQHDIAEFFWQTVIKNHTYVTGGNSDSEYFGQAGKLASRLGENTTETCNTYNMLKLTRHLFIWDAKPAYADYYERALFNHILSSQDPISGGVTYFHTLHPGSRKHYNMPFLSHTCCVGTGYENHAKYGEAIYYRTADDKGMFVNLFIASVINWKEKGLKVKQETSFPDESSTRLTLSTEKPLKLTLFLRYPGWATEGIQVKVNGKSTRVKKIPGSYIKLDRTWKNGDVIEMKMPMSLYTEFLPDSNTKGSVLYGPIVLAAELGKERPNDTFGVPVFINADKKNVRKWVKPLANRLLTFRTLGVGRPEEATLAPLFRIHDQHYSAYFDFFTEKDWENKQAEYERRLKEEKEISERTIDWIGIGEHQSERDHLIESKISYVYNQVGRMGRDVRDDGFLLYQAAVDPSTSNELMLTFWGSDTGRLQFDVLIDGKIMTNVIVKDETPGEFYNRFFKIPPYLIEGKKKITISFKPTPGNRAGIIYGIRILKTVNK
ncbi:MAG: glycoside hydrolase family 127 protein [Massilibacteroides sp.]|nr:glycoside hydrolase family 127 protein [Massilibacteroides sp.]MDD3061993.1 glycoside hydrolase family 127 protein [Massilibacteroides sp.]MDD4114048.1 glycoside hydrolase family 127 protein [Massilibacteroides sp.]MDD4659290.1 glycoside hydrolase family 127 protein [Massilibacteroides sp.]